MTAIRFKRTRLMSETDTQRLIITNCSRGNVRLWRNNNGFGYSPGGDPITYGLGSGTSDLIGLRSLIITPELVGHRIAQFVACEVKSPRGKASDEQRNFLLLVSEKGGLAMLVRSVEDAQEELR